MFFSKVFQLSGKQVLTFAVSAGILALVGLSLVRWIPQKSINIDELIKKANPETPFLNRVFSDLRLNYDDYLLWHFFISSSPELNKKEIRYYNNMMSKVRQMIKSSEQASDLINFFQTTYKYNNTAIESNLRALNVAMKNTNYPYSEILFDYVNSLQSIKSIDERSAQLLNTKISKLVEQVNIIRNLIEFERWRIDSDELKKELVKIEAKLNLVIKNLDKPAAAKTQMGSMLLKDLLGPFSHVIRLYSIVETGYYHLICERDLLECSTIKNNLFWHVNTLICNCLKEYEEKSKNDTLQN